MATRFVLKVVAGVIAAVIAALISRVWLFPMLDTILPTDQMRLDFVGSIVAWMISPEAIFWYLALASVGTLVLVLLRGRVPSRGRMVSFVAGFGIAALVFRLNNGWSGDELPLEPAEALVIAGWIAFGLVEWVISTGFVPETIEQIRDAAEDRRDFRDQRWIMREREGVELSEPVSWKRHYCNVSPHRPMRGLETCTHELDAARVRSSRRRRRIQGQFPQTLKHEGSPGYIDDAASRSAAEPVRESLLADFDIFEDIRRMAEARRGRADKADQTDESRTGGVDT